MKQLLKKKFFFAKKPSFDTPFMEVPLVIVRREKRKKDLCDIIMQQ